MCFAHGQAPITAERGGPPCSVSPCQSRTCERLENVSRPNPGPPFAQCNFLAILWGSKGDTTKANRTRVRDAKPRAPRGQPSFRMSTARPFGIVVRGAPRNPQRFRLGLRTAGRIGTTVPHLPCRTGVGSGRPRDGFLSVEAETAREPPDPPAPMPRHNDSPTQLRLPLGQASGASWVRIHGDRAGSLDLSSLDGFGQGRRGLEGERVGTRTLSARRSGSRAAVGTAYSGVVLKESCDVGRLGTLPSHPHLGPAVSVVRDARGSDVI